MKSLTLWDEMKNMQNQMDALFNSFWGVESMPENYRHAPADLYETKGEIISEIEMPGVDKKDIKVEVREDGIEVKAEKNVEIKKKGLYQRSNAGYYRYVALPRNVDVNKAKAEYKNGVLKIIIPKLKIKEEKRKMLEIN